VLQEALQRGVSSDEITALLGGLRNGR